MAHSRLGDIAQLVERCVRNAEVRGSSPLISTTASEQGSLCSDVFLLLAAASAAKSRRCIAPLPLPFCAKGSVCCGLFMMKPARVHAAASPFPRRKARRARRARRGAAGGRRQIEPCVQRVKSGAQRVKSAAGAARCGGRAAANRAMRAARQNRGAARQK